MGPAQDHSRNRTRSAEVTDSLIDSAMQILNDSGPDGLTVRAVAANAGVAPMGVYSRFGGKPGLLEALFVQGFEQLDRAVGDASGPDSLARLRNGCRAYRTFAVTNPQVYELMFKQMKELDLKPESLERAAEAFGQLVGRVADAMEAGLLAPGDSVDVAQQIWSGLHGGVSLELVGISFTPDAEATFNAMLDALLRGLAPR